MGLATAYSEPDALATADDLAIVTDMGGTPASKRISIATLQTRRKWAGKVAAAYGEGSPHVMLMGMNAHSVAATNPTPTNIGTSTARCSLFVLPFDLTVNKLRYFSLAAVSNAYSVAIYRLADLKRLTAQIDFNTSGTNAWEAAGSSLGIALAAGVPYFVALSVRATGTTSGVASFGITGAANTPQRTVSPQANAGNLSSCLGAVAGSLFQFAVSSGALPAIAAPLAVQAAWTGGCPAFFLDNSNA